MSRSSSLFVAVAAAGVVGFVAAPASASSLTGTEYDCTEGCNLKTLIDNNGYFLVGDKWFGNFKFNLLTNVANPIALPTAASQLTLLENITSDGFGLTLGGGMAAISFKKDGLFSIEDFKFGYDVHVHDPKYWISDIHMDFNPQTSGDGFASVSENVYEIDDHGLRGDLIGHIDVNSDPDAKLTDWAFLDKKVKWARIEKDIFLTSGDKGSATISIINQAISQTREVPEPGAMVGLLAIGSLGVSQILKRHKQENKN